MKSRYLFLLVYLLGIIVGGSSAQRSPRCTTCDPEDDATSSFLQCVGLHSTDTGKEHVQNLKKILEATWDIYTFMKSSMTDVPILSLEGMLELNPGADALQNEALVQMWVEVKMKPLLQSITKHFLSCLSTKNFSCSTYQTILKEISQYYAEINPVRQKWIYTFFIYPFLSGDGVAGCVNPYESSEDWLMKNFGAFRAMARLEDFSNINMVFTGLEVLHLLSPTQKAELLLSPEVENVDNGTLTLIFNSLLTGESAPSPSGNITVLPSTYNPYSSHSSLSGVVSGFNTAFTTIGSFAHEFVSFTSQRNLSEIKSTTLTQFLLNFTLAELANIYEQKNTSDTSETQQFDVTSVEDWYQLVVIPVLQRFWPNEGDLMHKNITLAFHELFFLDNGMNNESSEIEDVCSLTLDQASCGLTDAVENVAHVLHCAARSNLTLTETTVLRLINELMSRLNALIKELSTTNFEELISDFREIFTEGESPSLIQQHLEDPEYIKLWFQIKLLPLLPDVDPNLLSCLSTKNFSCPAYQTLVAALDEHMSFTDADPIYSYNVYKYFIYSFLVQRNNSDSQCISSANRSAEWLMNNFGSFLRFASITDFYELNPYFSGLEALPVLTPKQLAELLLLPLRTPPEKNVVIDRVFDFLLESPKMWRFSDVLLYVVELAEEVSPPCNVYRQIFDRMYRAIPFVSLDMEPVIWARIDDLINIAPEECVPLNVMCPETQVNATKVCSGIDSSDLQSYLNTSMQVSCNFALEKYACAELDSFTANQLASLMRCDLPGNSSRSKVLWKLLLTHLSSILDPVLDSLANVSINMMGPAAQEILDVIGELRLWLLTDEQLGDHEIIQLWFSNRLSGFLPFASGRFLHCLNNRNISCQSYQQILQVYNRQFANMSSEQQHVVLKNFVLLFLSAPHSGPGCVSFFNSSTEWLRNNFGSFSEFLSVRQLFDLNPQFNPLEALQLLTPKQTAELLVLNLPTLPNKDVLINVLFDYLTQSPTQRKLPEFLSHLVMFLQTGNLSCLSYKTLFSRLDEAVSGASSDVVSSILSSKLSLFQLIPPGCIIYSGECNVTMINETDICKGVNSTQLQIHLSSGMMSGHFCDFAVEEFACASLSALTAQDLAELLKCNRFSNSSGSTAAWKLLLSKASLVLNQALDLLANTTLNPGSPSVSMILDAIREIWLDGVNMGRFNDSSFIQLWFHRRLRPFLPAVSSDFLSCLSTKVLDCSTYQLILQVLSEVRPQMIPATQLLVYTRFIEVYLTRNDTADPACRSNINSSTEWLQSNLGGFFVLLSIQEIQRLYPDFSALDALSQLTATQLAEVSATPGLLTSADQVTMVMRLVPDRLFASFFDDFAAAIMGHENMLPSPVRSAFLDTVFARANLSYPWVDDSVVSLWLRHRLPPLLINLLPQHVTRYFEIQAGRNCSIEQQGVENLNSTISTLSEDSQQEIYNHIILALQGPPSLRCYGNDYNASFYGFIERSFLGFQFPNLTTFLSLIPQDRKPQLVNSIPPSHLGDFLRRPNVVDNEARLCELYSSYDQTPMFLATESLPAEVGRPTLFCVWPMALSTSIRSEVNVWFDRSLQNYLVFLTKSLLSSDATYNASCVAFQKLVLVLDKFNYTAADFERRDVFDTIRVYLTSATTPRCYNANNPELNSTAWFAEYIGPFMSFLTLEVLQSFGPEEVLQVFTVNPLNIALLNHSALPHNLTDYYTQLVYQQDSNFNPLLLPLLCRCVAPGLAFTQLTAGESMIVLQNLTDVCTDLDPQISAALTSNFGDNIDATTISALGNQSTSISLGQLKMISPQNLRNALNILATVMGWSEGQTRAIVQLLMSSGVFQVDSSSSLLTLGSLVVGVPSRVFLNISSSEILTASTHSSLVGYIKLAPNVVQQTFVSQIISVNNNNEMIIQNVPDELATEIPRVMLQGFTVSSSVVTTLNRKTWKKQQAELFFNVIAVENATDELGSPNNLTSSVLQGFTCTSVRTISRVQVKKLITACRRTAQNKVTLEETQLTCMYNYISGDADATNFDLYPPDMLLYYDYSLVPPSSCRFYFEQLGSADFSIFSSALSYKQTALFDNARSCLGITNSSLTQDNISVLGNMCCILDKSYIVNSDPSILEKLKTCPDLTDAQTAAVESLLIGGNTTYGAPSTWSEKTLISLEPLPLYLTSAFYINFSKKAKRIFLKDFLKVIKRNGVSRQKRRKMTSEIRKSNMIRTKRATDIDCTVGQITQVTISGDTFPFDYDDIKQFNSCLTAATVKDNLEAITQKVDQQDYLQIVLSKLREAYNSTIPEDQVQVLGPASRVATLSDISLWSITQIDTLAALMDSTNGEWDPSLAKAIISKYLSVGGNTLGSAELIAIGGPNLCALDVDVLGSISPQSLKNANTLDVSNCTGDKVEKLFNISTAAFLTSRQSTIPVSAYQLQLPFISGATLGYILSLVNSNISMDMATFIRINESIIQSLTVSDVKNLLGINLPDLKLYENQTVAQSWISRQLQSDLNTLGLNLVGRADIVTSTAAPSSASNTTTPSSGSNTTTPSSASNTTTPSSGSNTTTPSSASNTTTPSSASNTTTPSSASNTTTPSSASNTTTPSSASNTTTPSSASNTTTTPTTANTASATATTPTTKATATTSTTKTTVTTSTTKTTASTTKAAGVRIQANAGFSFLVFITLLISSQQILL